MDPPRRCPRDDPSSETALFERRERTFRAKHFFGFVIQNAKLRERENVFSRGDPRTIDRLEKRFIDIEEEN